MRLAEFAKVVDVDVQKALAERFMDNEAFYLKFLRRLLTSKDFEDLEALLQAEDWADALFKAHNLKGVTANLSLLTLNAQFAALVHALRQVPVPVEEIQALFVTTKAEWQKTLLYISELED